MFLGLPDPHPDPLVTSTAPDADADPGSVSFPFLISLERTEIMVAK
jgi:hypothetical protein